MNEHSAHHSWPQTIDSVEQLEDILSMPTPGTRNAVHRMDGDFLLLGIGGKMGPTLARQLKRALDQNGQSNRVIGVSRFSTSDLRERLESWGIETIACDLLDRSAIASLPDCPNIFYMTGQKFGSTGNEEFTWAMNVYLPAMVAERFPQAKIVALSTGNVYPLSPVQHGGSRECDPTDPIGEYAQSCLGRERMFEYFSQKNQTPVSIIRLNYAVELRYGILLDIAQKVYAGIPIDLSMGNVNVIWQGDANAFIIQSMEQCRTPARIINITGPEVLSIRRLAEEFGLLLDCAPQFEGTESVTALLNNAAHSFECFGYPMVSVKRLMHWISHWVRNDKSTLGKPTHYETRDGKF